MFDCNTSKPLQGVRIIEFEALGPAPIAGHILSGMGAAVTLIARPSAMGLVHQFQNVIRPWEEGKERVMLDIKENRADRARALDLVAAADILIEGLRPGVMERLELGPSDCASVNPQLVYGRMTGWGQEGPLAHAAGHDLNFVALSGLLSLSVRSGHAPIIPPTALGDGAGALGLAMGIVCALYDVRASGVGRVVDGAIVDVAVMLGLLAQSLHGAGQLGVGTPSPFHDSPFYDVYECSDGKFVTIGSLEPQFYALLLRSLALDDVDPRKQYDVAYWPELKTRVAQRFREKTRAEWCSILEGTDVCFAPVLDLSETHCHPHNRARSNFKVTTVGTVVGSIAPRFLPLTAE